MIHELLPATESVGDSMRRLIDAHAAKYPDTEWRPYEEIDYDREVAGLQRYWFSSVIEDDPPAMVPVTGLWFGLFLPIRGSGPDREAVADFYVAGSCEFELDGNGDWACSPDYFPEGRYAHSDGLAQIYRAAYRPRNRVDVTAYEYLCLGYVAFALKFILADVDPNLILSSDDPVGISAGWDTGDPLYVGFLTRNGFQVRDPQEAIAGIEKRREAFRERMKRRRDRSTETRRTI